MSLEQVRPEFEWLVYGWINIERMSWLEKHLTGGSVTICFAPNGIFGKPAPYSILVEYNKLKATFKENWSIKAQKQELGALAVNFSLSFSVLTIWLWLKKILKAAELKS